MRRLPLFLAPLAAAAVLVPAAALAQQSKPAAKPARQCFFTRDWQGWKADGEKGMYIRVNLHDVYRVDFASGCPGLTWPNNHLVTSSTTGSVCSALDLDIQVSDSTGFKSSCIASGLTKLDAAQVAALPKKQRP